MKLFNHRDKSLDRYAWILFFLGLFIVFAVITLPACKTSMPAIDVSFWAGDHAKDGVSRAQEGKTLLCADEEFDDYVCISYEDLKKVFALLQECQEWPSSETLVRADYVLKRFAQRNPEVMEHVTHNRQKRMEPVSN